MLCNFVDKLFGFRVICFLAILYLEVFATLCRSHHFTSMDLKPDSIHVQVCAAHSTCPFERNRSRSGRASLEGRLQSHVALRGAELATSLFCNSRELTFLLYRLVEPLDVDCGTSEITFVDRSVWVEATATFSCGLIVSITEIRTVLEASGSLRVCLLAR